MYYGIFLVIFFLISGITKESESRQFQETSVNMGFVDLEHTPLSEGIQNYLESRHVVRIMENDKEFLQDALYGAEVSIIVRIPSGFTQAFLAGDGAALETITPPTSLTEGYLMDAQLENFLGNLRLCLAGGMDLDTALERAEALTGIQTEVTIPDGQKIASDSELPGIYYYFRYFAYVLLCVMLSCVCPVFIVFYQPDVYRRSICSRLPLKAYNIQLALGTLCFTAFVLITLNVIGFLTGIGNVTLPQGLLLIANTSVFALVGTSIAYLCGFIAKSDTAVSGLANVISLGMCFLGGIFVNLDVISDKVQAVSRLLPTYWYTTVNQLVFENEALTSELNVQIIQGLGLQLAFAAAVCAIALLLSRKRHQYMHI